MISLEMVTTGIILLFPIYGYLYTINSTLSSVIAKVDSCPYCNRTIEVKGLEHDHDENRQRNTRGSV